MDESFWCNKRVFVTGATGLLGSQLTSMLMHAGAKVTVLVLDEQGTSPLIQSRFWSSLNVVRGQLQDYPLLLRTLNEYDIEYVFHLGAQTQVMYANRQPWQTFESNVRGTYNLLEACRMHPGLKGVMVASSDKAYGSQPQLPYTEDAPLQGRHPYDVSKSCADLLAQAYYVSYKMPVCITRCGNLYGPGDLNFARIVPEAIRAAHHGYPLELRSDGTFIRDYLFVEDAADGYLTIAENMHRKEVVGQAFNLSTKNKLTVIDIVKAIEQVAGKPIEICILNNATNEIKDQYLESHKAKNLLGWEPKHMIIDGLAKTVPAYVRFFETGRWEDADAQAPAHRPHFPVGKKLPVAKTV